MLDAGMFEELVEYFRSGEHERVNPFSLGMSIGVPEFETYFKKFPETFGRIKEADYDENVMEAYNEAVRRIKENTYQLAKKQGICKNK
ncbi:hypothetical protein L1987_15751 [Smallanthus sonchifolius]|uniref:Uncharacterized protein n=1 Tax=Smallanthus sonchifolius TaxID=185202 RepID=A0ACB9J7G1_9ASTR|nr:hypothetical protein L1987_15751 [Smallanthus sonchifolius]